MPNRQGNPMTDLIKRLRSLAEKAIPGPWEVGTHPSMVVAPCPCCGLVATAAQYGPSESAECYNSEYIAAANPLAVLELLDMIEKLRAALQAIIDHQDLMGGTIAHLSSTRHIAANALAAEAAGE